MSAEVQKSAAAATTTEVALLDQILDQMPKAVERDRGKEMVETLVGEVMQGTMKWDKNVSRTLNSAIAAIDAKITQQLSAIMHNEAFQKLEGSWRGLHHLVMNSETSAQLKLKVMNLTKKEITKDLEKAVEFDQSQLFKKIYESEFGMPGGEPQGALVGDYEWTNHPDDIDTLQKISGVCAAAHCPFLSAASPSLFGFDNWTDLTRPRDLEKIFLETSYVKWNALRDSDDARYLCLTMPRVLARLPYGKDTKPVEEFDFEEARRNADGKLASLDHNEYTWMNSSYVLASRLTNAYSQTSWCTAIRGVENGGKVEGLPCHVFTSDDGDADLKCPTEVGITDRREAELSKLGFLPLCHFKNTDYSVFFGAQTVQKPKKYDRPDATANAAISARLPYIMAASRISHFLKCIARDKIGSFMERQDMEDFLKRWIANYVLDDPKPSPEMKARYPLAAAEISVKEIPGKPGSYNAVAHLRPWLQLEELTASMRMVAELPKKA